MDNANDRLRELLILGHEDPSKRPEFYKELMNAEVFVLGFTGDGNNPIPATPEESVVQAGEEISLIHIENEAGEQAIPFFSSMDVLQQFLEEETGCLKLAVRDLFEITLGQDLVLNPGDEVSKFFNAFEIGEILKTGMPMSPEKHVVEEERQVMIGQPDKQPTELLETAGKIFAKSDAVKKAWLVLYFDQAYHKVPAFLIGMDCPEDKWDEVCQATYTACAQFLGEDQGLDFVPVNSDQPDDFAQGIMNVDKPFFEKSGT